MGILTSGCFITNGEISPLLSFLGKVFEELRFLGVFPFSFDLSKILTGDNLRRGGFDFVDWCIMCCHCGETVDHLLLHCEMAHRLSSFVFTSFGFLWVIPRIILDLLFGWWNWLGKHSSNIWNLVLLSLLWCL